MSRQFSSAASALLLSSAVLALASPAARAQAPLLSPTPAAYNWSGFYLGGFGGVAWADINATELFTDAFGGAFYTQPSNSYDLFPEGFTAGGQAGYDWQLNNFVFGVAGEFGYMDLDDSVIDPNSLPVPGSAVQPYTAFQSDWYGALTGRVGVPFDRLLIFAKAGVAFLNAEASTVDTCGRSFCGQTTIDATGEGVLLGWTVGGGVEAAVTEHIRAGVEYRFYDFETFQVSGVASPNGLEYHQDIDIEDIHTARAFVNFRW